MASIDLDSLTPAERQRIQRRNALRTALVLAAAAVTVFGVYIWQVARMSG